MKINGVEFDDMRGETAKWLAVQFFVNAEKDATKWLYVDAIEVTANGKLVDVAALADEIDTYVAREIENELGRERKLDVDRIQELVSELSQMIDDANRVDEE